MEILAYLRVEGQGTETRSEQTKTMVLSIKAMSSLHHPPNHSFKKHFLSTFLAKGLALGEQKGGRCAQSMLSTPQAPLAPALLTKGHRGPDFERGAFVLS